MRDIMRTRWAAIGAAVAVTLGAGGVSLTQAALTTGEKPVYVSLDAPCRVIDTRSGSPIGPGDANSLTVQITGTNGECTGALAIPADAVGVATNVTAIQPMGAASGRSYFTVYPADATRPVTSNLNFVNGQPPVPNKVDVGLSADGKIILYNNEGTAHAAVDIFGYYIDHGHTGADIVDASLTHVDIADEPGVATTFAASSTVLTNAVQRVVSTSIRVPADGYLVAQASGIFVGTGTGSDEALCQLVKGGLAGSVPDTTAPWTKLNDFGVDGSGTSSGFATHRTFEVDVADNPALIIAGQSIGLDCVKGTGTSQINSANITVTYYPRSYEPISLAPIP